MKGEVSLVNEEAEVWQARLWIPRQLQNVMPYRDVRNNSISCYL